MKEFNSLPCKLQSMILASCLRISVWFRVKVSDPVVSYTIVPGQIDKKKTWDQCLAPTYCSFRKIFFWADELMLLIWTIRANLLKTMLLMLIHVFSLQKNFQIELLSLRKSARKSSYLYLRNIGNDSMPSFYKKLVQWQSCYEYYTKKSEWWKGVAAHCTGKIKFFVKETFATRLRNFRR